MPPPTDAALARRVELILQHIESLPTLSVVAVRLVRLITDDNADMREIAQVVESDPALSARVLAWCRRSDIGVRNQITSIQRAVVMMGAQAVRASVLSAEVFELFKPSAEDDAANPTHSIDRAGFWRHCLSVACASESIAEAMGGRRVGLDPSHAYLCGLLHDLGKLALDALLPRAYAKVAAIAEERQADIADVERRVLGIDHHTAGKRLAEHWGLPHALLDVLWLHGQPSAALPDLPHRNLIQVVTAADAIARQSHLGWSGNQARIPARDEVARELGIEPAALARATDDLHTRVAARAETLGLQDTTDHELLIDSLAQANRQLALISRRLDESARATGREAELLAEVALFHKDVGGERTFGAMLTCVARSVGRAFGAGWTAFIWRDRSDADATLHRLSTDGSFIETRQVPPDAFDNTDPNHAALVAWAATSLANNPGARHMRAVALPPMGGPQGIVLFDQRDDAAHGDHARGVLAGVWAAALAAAARHDGAKRLSEKLADANRRLADAQNRLVEEQSLARLGELAAGAAHEMNNPLTVISGKSQVLARRLTHESDRASLRSIIEASEKLSDLITSLHFFAQPPKPAKSDIKLATVVQRATQGARTRLNPDQAKRVPETTVIIEPGAESAHLDEAQIQSVLTELLLNAMQAQARSQIEVRVHVDSLDDRLLISVRDDGVGMPEHTLNHAFDPFFSDRSAGRGAGLGLARARRLVDLHSGELRLESSPGEGTTAIVTLPTWRCEKPKSKKAA